MKIGFIHFRFHGNDGVSLESERWKSMLEQMGHEVTFIAGKLDRPGILIPELEYTFPRVQQIHDAVIYGDTNYKEIEKEIFTQAGEIEGILRELFRENHFDLLIVANVFSLPIHFPLAVALERVINEFGIPTIAKDHDFWWERERYLKSHCFEFFKRFFPPLSPYITHMTINSIAQKDLKIRTGLDSLVVGDCFDFESNINEPDQYSKQFRKDFDIAEDDLVFLQATRLVPRKNIEKSIELVEKMADHRVVLVIAGHSGDEGDDYLIKLKELSKKAQIRARFIGHRIDSERKIIDDERHYTLWDAFINSDIMTYPSVQEGFGNQFIEATYFKKPIFVNRYPVFISDIEPLGFETIAINEEITQNCIENINNLLNNPAEIKSITEKNFQIAKTHFSYEATSEKIHKLMIRALMRKPAKSTYYVGPMQANI